MTTDAFIERAVEAFHKEYHRIYPTGGDEADHEDAIRSAVSVVVELAQEAHDDERAERFDSQHLPPGVTVTPEQHGFRIRDGQSDSQRLRVGPGPYDTLHVTPDDTGVTLSGGAPVRVTHHTDNTVRVEVKGARGRARLPQPPAPAHLEAMGADPAIEVGGTTHEPTRCNCSAGGYRGTCNQQECTTDCRCYDGTTQYPHPSLEERDREIDAREQARADVEFPDR